MKQSNSTPMALLPNEYHPSERCSCHACLAKYPDRPPCHFGGGKYDDEAEELLKRIGAKALVLLVHEGKHGDGFEVQGFDPVLIRMLPNVLRGAAAAIEHEIVRLQDGPPAGRPQ